jgi:transcriptional regulator with XRE-family HTH domain
MFPVAPSRLGPSVRSARERKGWTRETLATHSGLSWAAISQIESGRRQEVRVSSLVALANALDVSVDYLVGSEATLSPGMLRHRVLVYGSDEEYVAIIVPFLRDGLARSEPVLVVTAPRQTRLLHDALGDDAPRVEFRDSSRWYTAGAAASNAFLAFARDRFDGGAPWIRIVGEPLASGRRRRSESSLREWIRYESMLNLTLASSPATVMCPYDMRRLPDSVVTAAQSTHPEVVGAGEVRRNPEYCEPTEFLLNLT